MSTLNTTVTTLVSQTLSSTMSTQSKANSLDWRDDVLIGCYVVIFLLGVVGNIIVCYIIGGKKDQGLSTMELLILCLAIVDLISSVVNPVMFTYWQVTHHKTWHFGYIGCIILPSLTRILVSFSIGIILIITLDRYYVICRPFEQQFSRLKIFIGVYAALLLSVLMDLPYLMYQKIMKETQTCEVPDTSDPGFAVPMIIILIVRDISFVAIFFTTVFLIRRELFEEEKRRVLAQTNRTKNLRNVIAMLIVMAALFMVLVFPRDIFHIAYIGSWMVPPGIPYSMFFLNLNAVLKILHMTNSVVNVFIYARLHGEFKKRLKRRWLKLFGRERYTIKEPNGEPSPIRSFAFVDSMINESFRDRNDEADNLLGTSQMHLNGTSPIAVDKNAVDHNRLSPGWQMSPAVYRTPKDVEVKLLDGAKSSYRRSLFQAPVTRKDSIPVYKPEDEDGPTSV